MPEIVPVELTLPSGTWFTLHQRDWEDADDDSLAFLGGDDSVHAFRSTDELTSYAVGADDHHLADSPLWAEVRRWPRRAFEPDDDQRYDLRVPDARARAMLAELLVYVRIEPPPGDWLAEPMANLLPSRQSVYGLPLGAPDPRPAGGMTIWEWALTEVDGRVGPPVPEVAAGAATGVPAETLVPLERVVPGVEALWLGADGDGAHTLLARDDDGGYAFLGEAGAIVVAGTTEGLAGFLAAGTDPVLEGPPWSALRTRDDVDLEPYADNVVDLDQLGDLLAPGLDRAGAQALLDVRTLVQELGSWLELDEVTRAFDEDRPLGRLFVRDLLDHVGGSGLAAGRLAEVDFEPLRAEWDEIAADIASRMEWVD